MRTLLALVALVAPTVAAVTVHEADACGSYRPMPIAYEVEHHGWGKSDRQFVVFGSVGEHADIAQGEHAWQRVGPRDSYDNAEFAFGKKLDEAMGVTLLAPGRTTYVTTTSLGVMRDYDGLKSAVEIKKPKAQYVIALHGKREDAKLTALTMHDEQAKWTIEGTGYSLQYEALEGQDVHLVLRNHGQVVQALGGEAVGVLTANEGTFLAVQESWGVNLVEI